MHRYIPKTSVYCVKYIATAWRLNLAQAILGKQMLSYDEQFQKHSMISLRGLKHLYPIGWQL